MLAIWTVAVEPIYLPGYNRQSDTYSPFGVGGVLVHKKTHNSLLLFMLSCQVVYRLRWSYLRHVYAVTLIVHNQLYWVSYKSCGFLQYFVLPSFMELQERETFREELLRLWGYPGMTVDGDHNPNNCFPRLMPQGILVFSLALLLCALAITRETSARKDFLQANIVQKEGQQAEYVLTNLLPTSAVTDLRVHMQRDRPEPNEWLPCGPLYPKCFRLVTVAVVDAMDVGSAGSVSWIVCDGRRGVFSTICLD